MAEKLSQAEVVRYARHLNIPELGEPGQLKLKESSALIAGCGGLGSASALFLAAAGIGKIGLVDSDTVELSNLQRQIIHSTESIGQPKVDSAKNRLVALNPHVEIFTINDRIVKENGNEIIRGYAFIVDATDNFETRYILNAACAAQNIPFIYGAVYQFSGQMSVFNVKHGPCFQCVFQNPPTAELTAANRGVGVVGALPGLIGSLQALEVIKLCAGIGKPMAGRLLIFDGMEMDFKEISINRNQKCPVCSSP